LFDERPARAPILVLGIGNILLGDDGAGVELVTRLSVQAERWGDKVELLEGGTQGMALLGYIAGRSAIVLFDAVELGAEPGSLHLIHDEEVLAFGSRSSSAHEGNVGELLRTARLTGDLPRRLALVGVEPARVETGIGLSEQVENSLPAALQAATKIIDCLLMESGGSRPLSNGEQREDN
jgi:hydrogenase maturation protease